MTTAITVPIAPTAPVALDAETGLRRVLLLDAVVTGANGLAYLAGATALDGLLGPSPGDLRTIGALLTVYAVVVAVVATRRPVPAAGGRELMAVNGAWVLASLGVAATGALGLAPVGRGWVVAQALVVAGIVALQRWALARRCALRA